MDKTLSLGADPEFTLQSKDTKRFIPARDVLPRSTHSRVGCDGCSSTGEVRPQPSNDTEGLVKNISLLFKSAQRRYLKEKVDMRAGSLHNSQSLGGHIHFGKHLEDRYHYTEIPDKGRIIASLDLVSMALLNIERRESARERRMGVGYGQLGDYRGQEHGFEYRTPSSWLINPETAKGVLAIYHIIMLDHENGMFKNNPLWDGLLMWYHDNKETARIRFKQCDRRFFEDKIPLIIKGITNTLAYTQNCYGYKDIINTMIPKIVFQQEWDEDVDVLDTWGMYGLKSASQLFAFQLRDMHIQDLQRLTGNKRISHNLNETLATPIRIYGLSNTYQYDIAVSSPKLQEMVEGYLARSGKPYRAGYRRVYNEIHHIGLNMTLRESDMEFCKDLLLHIKGNASELARSYDRNTPMDETLGDLAMRGR